MSAPLHWKKTSRSLENNCVELGCPPLQWIKSSCSGHTDCVEVAATAIRDSKNPGPTLHFPAPHLAAFLTSLTEHE
jgi:Domain of unknown function (DUF397)